MPISEISPLQTNYPPKKDGKKMDEVPVSAQIEELVTPPRKETLAASVAAQLKSLMFRRKLQAGEKLPPERELARLFKVSRVVIKQALLSLEQSGFVEIKLGSRGGAFVTYNFNKPITIFMEDLQRNGDLRISHFQDVRRALECAALQSTLENNREVDLTRLTEIQQEFVRPENRIRHAELNIAFHLALADLSGNPLITLILSSLMETVFSYPGPTISEKFMEKARNDHGKIIEALRNRDSESAKRLLVQNIDLVNNKKL